MADTLYKNVYPRLPWSQEIGYIQPLLDPNVGPTVAQYGPAVYASNQSYQTPKHQTGLELFIEYRQSRFGIPFDPALFVGAFSQLANSYRTAPHPTLTLQRYFWSQDVTFTAQLNQFVIGQIIAPSIIQQSYAAYHTPPRRTLPPQHQIWVSVDWITTSVNAVLPTFIQSAMTQLQSSYRTPEKQQIGSREQTGDMDQGWIQYVTTLPPTEQPLRPPCDVTWYRNFS